MTSRFWVRVSAPATHLRNVAKTLVQTLLFWFVFLVALPYVIQWIELNSGLAEYRFTSRVFQFAGMVLFAVGGVLGLTSGITMAVAGRGTPLPIDSPRNLAIAGVYRYVRNPMAIAGIGQGIAVGLILGSPLIILYAILGAVIWNAWVRRFEEADLLERFGDDFRDYQSAVRCWLPRITPYNQRDL